MSLDIFVYSYVPKEALDDVLSEGLYGGNALLKRHDLLAKAAKGRKISAEKFEKELKESLEKKDPAAMGPNILFGLPPSLDALEKNTRLTKEN